MIQLLKTMLILVFLVSCGIMDTDENYEQENGVSIHLKYNGLVSVRGGYASSFSLVNDSTDAVQYFAYSKSQPFYNAEALSDTGWTNLTWGWCGTGAELYALEPDSSVDFLATLPTSSCTWRLVLDITDTGYEYTQRIRSENIIYTATQD